MRDSLVEPIGLLCRWLLLVLTVGAMAAGAWAAALASHGVAGDVAATMVVPDRAFRPGSRAQLKGLISPPASPAHFSTVMCGRPGGVAMFGRTQGKWIYPELFELRVGVNRLTIRGMPYSALAYQHTEALIGIVPPETVVFLFDARMAGPEADRGQLRACLQEMHERGQPVLFHGGPVDEFVDVRRRLRKLDRSVPISCELTSQPDAVRALRAAAVRLGRHLQGARKPLVVTADAQLARWAHGTGFITYLVGPADGKATPSGVLRLESLAKFKEYLAPQPIFE